MIYIVQGLGAFAAVAVFEWASLHGIAGLKQVMGVCALVLWSSSLMGAITTSDRVALSGWLSGCGWVVVVVFGFLLVYSVFVEIPFSDTYAQSGTGDELITVGTYALCRHPGVIWYTFLLSGLALATRSSLLLWAVPIWTVADALYVWIEEKLYLERVFAGYREYEKDTPMLLPTMHSVRRCLETIGRQGHNEAGRAK